MAASSRAQWVRCGIDPRAWLLTLTFLTPWISAAGQTQCAGSHVAEALPRAGPRTGVTKHLTSRGLYTWVSWNQVSSLDWRIILSSLSSKLSLNISAWDSVLSDTRMRWDSSFVCSVFCSAAEDVKWHDRDSALVLVTLTYVYSSLRGKEAILQNVYL